VSFRERKAFPQENPGSAALDRVAHLGLSHARCCAT
jgi:hypothetical protein